jgi:hypothetical protein
MAYEYNVPGIRFDLVGKAISDALYRQAQLEAKKQIDFQNQIDKEYRLYSGKVRKQDSALFDSAYQEYENVAKEYSRLNRRGGERFKQVSKQLYEKRKSMMDIVEDSTQWGAQGINIEKLRKDSKGLIDQDKYFSYMNDLYTMNTAELNKKYNGIQNAPKIQDFEWKPESVKSSDLVRINTYVKGRNEITPGNTLKVIPTLNDDGTVKTRSIDLEFGGQKTKIDVPLKTIAVGPNPIGILNAVTEFGQIPSIGNLYKGMLTKTLADAANANNPAQQDLAIKSLSKASELFNVTRDEITPEILYASTYVNPDMMGNIEVEDWDTALKKISIPEKELGMKARRIAMAKAIKEMKDSNAGSGLDKLNKMLTVLTKVQNTGSMFHDDMKNTIQGVFKGLGWDITQDAFNKMWEGSFLNKLSQRTGGITNMGIPGLEPEQK